MEQLNFMHDAVKWLELALTPIASVPVYECRAREGDYIPFANASAGQQVSMAGRKRGISAESRVFGVGRCVGCRHIPAQ